MARPALRLHALHAEQHDPRRLARIAEFVTDERLRSVHALRNLALQRATLVHRPRTLVCGRTIDDLDMEGAIRIRSIPKEEIRLPGTAAEMRPNLDHRNVSDAHDIRGSVRPAHDTGS